MVVIEPEDRAVAVRAAFAGHHGTAPDVVARAPGRVNLVGEHTDYNGGLVLPVALPVACWVAARARDDGLVTARSRQQPGTFEGTLAATGPGGPTGWHGYAVGVLWALAREGVEVPGADLVVDSTVPLGAGLSSSAALGCAVGAAVLGLAGRETGGADAELLVRAAITAEQEVAGAPTGGMDQTVSVHAEPGRALLLDLDSGRRRHLDLRLAERGLRLVVTDTRVAHALVDGGYAARRADCEQAAGLLGVPSLRHATPHDVHRLDDKRLRRRVRHVVSEIARVEEVVAALDADDLPSVGDLLVDSHRSLRDDFEVSCPELDLAVEAALAAGALGARMTGGGFGGSTVALVPAHLVDAVVHAVDRRFAQAGFAPPQHLVADPSGGARRV